MSEHNMTASQVVTQLRSQVEEKTALTISAGIAPNKMLAKVNVNYCLIDCRSALTKTSPMDNGSSILTAQPSHDSCGIFLCEKYLDLGASLNDVWKV